jgi:ParB family chromosome partitioning protein
MPKFGSILDQVKDRTGTQDSRAADIGIRDIPLGDIEIRENVRKEYMDIEGLKESNRKYGLLHPITVYLNGDTYIVKTGHRRFLACRMLYQEEPDRFHSIRSIVSNADNLSIIQLVENIQRADLSQKDLYDALSSMREQGLTLKQIAAVMGKDESYIKKIFVGVNEISKDKNLEKMVSYAGVTIEDVIETKGIPDESERFSLLERRKNGDLNRAEMRKKVRELKDNKGSIKTVVEKPTDHHEKTTISLLVLKETRELKIILSNTDDDKAFDSLVDEIQQFFLDHADHYSLSTI